MRKRKTYDRGYRFISVYIEDNSFNSPEYFQITEFPTRLTAGKNLFKFRLKPNTFRSSRPIEVSIIDKQKNPIYSELVDFEYEDGSRVISIYVYEDTAPGEAIITMVGELIDVPDRWRDKINIRWSRSIFVNPTLENETEIIFEKVPTIEISELLSVQQDRNYTINQFLTQSAGLIQYVNFNNTPTIVISGSTLSQDMEGGTFSVNNPNNLQPTPLYQVSSTQFTSSIKRVISDTTAELETPWVVTGSKTVSYQHIYRSFNFSPYLIQYEDKPGFSKTENTSSYALLTINSLEPATGNIDRIKVFIKGQGDAGTYTQINDISLEEQDLFIRPTSLTEPAESRIGDFESQSVINTYWARIVVLNGIFASPDTLIRNFDKSTLINSVFLSSSSDLNSYDSFLVFYIDPVYTANFTNGSNYKIQFNAEGIRNSNKNPLLYVYASGSSFEPNYQDQFNQIVRPVTFGKRIGRIEMLSNNRRFDNQKFEFSADANGTGIIGFIIKHGNWKISNVRISADTENNYTPNFCRIKSKIPDTHKSKNQLEFLVKYYNKAGEESKQFNTVKNLDWEGGNRYIDGDFSLLTGSLYVADTLDSGIVITGLQNTGYIRSLGYSGFNAGNPGFLIWSGSALSGSTDNYGGVGLELYLDQDNYFQYKTNPAQLIVKTQTFFFGNSNTQYISGSAGNLEISSSGFYLSPQGNVTTTSIQVISGSQTMLDTSNGFVDGYNVSRCIPIIATGSGNSVFTVFPSGERYLVIFGRSNSTTGKLGAGYAKLDGVSSDATKFDTGSYTTIGSGQVVRHVIDIGSWRPFPFSDFSNTAGFLEVYGENIVGNNVTVLAVRNLGEIGATGSLSNIVNTT